MVKGERDYTQRVLATVSPSALVGGRVIYFEDFESQVMHTISTTGSPTITTTQDQVYDGSGSGKFSLGLGANGTFNGPFILPALGHVAGEFIFMPGGSDLELARINVDVHDGEHQYLAGVRIYDDGSNLNLQYLDSTSTWTTHTILSAAPISQLWHLLRFSADLVTGNYISLQFDARKIIPSNLPYATLTAALSPGNFFGIEFKARAGAIQTVYFDDIAISYEEP